MERGLINTQISKCFEIPESKVKYYRYLTEVKEIKILKYILIKSMI